MRLKVLFVLLASVLCCQVSYAESAKAHRYVTGPWVYVKRSPATLVIPYIISTEVDCNYPVETAVCNGFDIVPNDGNKSHDFYTKLTEQGPVMDSDGDDARGCKGRFFSRAIQGAWIRINVVCEPMWK